ncbi:DNA primase [Candidatus Poriferisocius sp.]|uniref:DNA primase n=1 Tax=Candidatus Poriferisocius sp. TaxID=3101276 RepID=UPI003B022CFC
MGIHDEDVARVREATDIVAVISEYVQLKRVGRRWQGLCPFHAEKTPSFSVNAEMGVYHCFGCKASGDAITFVREIEHADFVEAVERLAGRSGIALRYTAPGEGADRAKRGKLSEALEQAVEWYHQRLLTAPDAGMARRYLRERGYDGDVVRQYKLGWAPDDWDALAKDLGVGTEGGMPVQVFSDAGLGFRNKGRRIQDSFRARLLFPIFDPSSKPVGFGGRVLPGGEGPKYKNSVDNAVYRKSRILYGLNWAKQDIVNAGEVIVCEGYTDVIGFAQAGISRAVATCGTAATEDHIQMLRRFASRIVLAFDPDTAGSDAAERFLQWEGEIEVKVAVFPTGTDPGELAKTDPEGLVVAVEEAMAFPRFRYERVLSQADLATIRGRSLAARQATEVVAPIKDPLVRDPYLLEIATRCRQDDANALERLSRIAQEYRPPRPRNARFSANDRPDDAPHPAETAEGFASENGERYSQHETIDGNQELPPNNVERQVLWLAANEPSAVWPEIGPEMFHYPLYQDLLKALLEYPEMNALLAEADPRLVALMQELLVVEDEDLRASSHRQEVAMAILLYESAQRELTYLERQARTGSADDDLLRRVATLKTAMDKLRESEWEPEQAHALLELLRPEA